LVISGSTGITPCNADKAQVLLCISECDTNTLLCKFWEDEEIAQKLLFKEEETTSSLLILAWRKIDTQYFKTGPPINIGDSLPTALYTRMESRFQSRPEISRQYYDFLHQYLELGHIKSVTDDAATFFKPVYIPHHAVI
jgi:hypothetical protein